MNFSIFVLRLKKILSLIFSFKYGLIFLRFKVVAGIEHEPILSLGFNSVVDIGANIGQFSLATRKFLPNAKIFAFEPMVDIAARYAKLFEQDDKVKLFKVAIGPCVKDAVIHRSARNDSSSLLSISEKQTELFPGTHEVGLNEIKMSRLHDKLHYTDISSPSLLKLDVQGYELQALEGCDSLIKSFDYIYCEASFVELYVGQGLASEVIAYLAIRGFDLVGFYNPAYNLKGLCVQADFLFKKNS